MRRVELLLRTLALVLAPPAVAVHPEDPWDDRIDSACCPYPEHDPRDYNWPYSHFQYSEVIPDVVSSFVSMTSLNLTYQDGTVVEYGKPISPSRVARAPAVEYALDSDRDSSTLHTLMMVDPDVPFRDTATEGERLLWLLYDIPGNDTSRAKTLVDYAPPAPRQCPPSDRLCLQEHRVTCILWEQQHGPLALQAEDRQVAAKAEKGRLRYKARDFAVRHRLGLQIAMNFFETWHDPGDGSFDRQPWYHVRDAESLAKLTHAVPQLERRKTVQGQRKDEL
jgi:hypothetical protein